MPFPTFATWAAMYGKVYDGEEAVNREAIYNANVALYTSHNEDTTQTFTMGVNQFSDMTNDEFRATYASGLKGKSAGPGTAYLGEHKYEGEELADSLDWVAKGAVTPVKNQGQCGSCWAFSTTGSLEGASQISSGQLKSISEQQLVDCSGKYGNQGCNGGLMDDGFKYAEANNMATESSYPYTARDGSCKSSFTTALPQGAVTGYKDVTANSADAMMSALQLGPVSIALDGGGAAFQGYKSGVLTGSCGSQLDHGVLTVGYGTLNGNDYWKVKNSWGASWGMDGYILLTRETGIFKKSGECGMLAQPSYPVVSESVAV